MRKTNRAILLALEVVLLLAPRVGALPISAQPTPRATDYVGKVLPWASDAAVDRFVEVRSNELALLASIGQRAFHHGNNSLEAMVEAIDADFESYRSRSRESEAQAFRSYMAAFPDAGYFIARKDSHRDFVRAALGSGQIPIGLEFQPWELDLAPESGARTTFAALRLGSEVFSGLQVVSSNGVSRFSGQSHDDCLRILVVVHDPRFNVQVQTLVIETKTGHKSIQRSIFSDTTGDLLSNENL